MSGDTDFREFFSQKVLDNQLDSETLKVIKELLTKTPIEEARETLNRVGLGKVFEKLNTTNANDVELTCEVLSLCFSNLNLGDVVQNYKDTILFLLKHENPGVRKLAVYEIHRTVAANPTMLPLPEYTEIYLELARRVGDTDLGVVTKAIDIISRCNAENHPSIIEELKVPLQGNSSSRCNAYEVIINISSRSEQNLNLCASYGFLDNMTADLDSKDMLLHLNVLELLTKLAVTRHGINYLVKVGVLEKISNHVGKLESNPFANILSPGYMKFFGCIAHLYPKEIFENYPIIVKSLFDTLQTDDVTLLPAALETFGYVGATAEGKMSFVALGAPFTEALKRVGELVRNSPTEIKVRALNCMENLIGCKDVTDQQITLMTQQWFRYLSESPCSIDLLYQHCKNPFTDIKLAAFGLLNSICQYPWGHEMIMATPGFIEYLLDRAMDHTKAVKETKHEILKKISMSSKFDPSTIVKLKQYVEQGPFFVEAAYEVMMGEPE